MFTGSGSAKILGRKYEEVQKGRSPVDRQYIGSVETAEKHMTAKIFKENRHTSVTIVQDSVQGSLQNPAEKILQICTDSQRSKTWLVDLKRSQITKKTPEKI